jgi:ABC-type proline/glycine betaine transport system permease subunit
MKRIIGISIITATPFTVNAQDYSSTWEKNMEIFRICSTILAVALFMLFILAIMKRILEYRLKNRIVEKGIPENIVSSILQTSSKEDRNINIKWFAILAGLGIGLTIIYYTLPLGIHSLAIMAFCIAASFLGYFFFLRQSER